MGQPHPVPRGGAVHGGDGAVSAVAHGRQAHHPQGVLAGTHLSDRHHAKVVCLSGQGNVSLRSR